MAPPSYVSADPYTPQPPPGPYMMCFISSTQLRLPIPFGIIDPVDPLPLEVTFHQEKNHLDLYWRLFHPHIRLAPP